MILYYDNYIIDQPLVFSSTKPLNKIRNSDSVYKNTKKVDIAKYTLASYKVFPWSKVIIKFDAEKEEDKIEFMKYAKSIFPDAEVIPSRSDNQKKYREVVDRICKMNDEWIFFVPNNDHPMVINDIDYIYKLIEVVNKYKEQYKYISILYTCFSEYNNIHHTDYYENAKIIEDTNLARITVKELGFYMSCQIINKDLLEYLFCSHDMGNTRIIRVEDLQQFFWTPNQLVILPKREICAHFDGYSHTHCKSNQITPDQVPPLFIPPGFFENNIKIAYGYNKYREGWVNINPSTKYYSFRNKKDITDLKINIEDIPLFWKDKVVELDINSKVDFNLLKKKRDENFEILKNPWRDLSYRIKIRIKSFLYHNIYVSSVVFLRRLLNK